MLQHIENIGEERVVRDAGQRQIRKESAFEQESPYDTVEAPAVAQSVCTHHTGQWEEGW